MNYYDARELHDKDNKPTGLFHYTCSNDGKTYAVGHCSPTTLCPYCKGRCGVVDPTVHCANCENRGLVRKENPCPGHATKEEAYEHYRQYLLDNAIFHGPRADPWPKYKCAVDGCKEEGTHCALVDHNDYPLCPAHADRQALDGLVGVGWRASSY